MEEAVERVLGYADPVVVALGHPDAVLAEAIEKALLAPAPAVESEEIAKPQWAALPINDALAELDRWAAPDEAEDAAALEIAQLVGGSMYGSRTTGTALFDSDVDLRVTAPLKDVAHEIGDWAIDVDLIRARVPVVKGEHRASGVHFDVSNSKDCIKVEWRPLVRFCKLLLRQNDLDETYSRGLGSFRLYVALNAYGGVKSPLGAAAAAFLRFVARSWGHVLVAGDHCADLADVDPRIVDVCTRAADRLDRGDLPLDVASLARHRANHARKARAWFDAREPLPPPPAKKRKQLETLLRGIEPPKLQIRDYFR